MTESRIGWREVVALVAAAGLAWTLLRYNPPRELAERVHYLAAYAPRDLAVRRLGGSSAAFDRRFFLFLESARRRLPVGVAGVAVLMPEPGEPALYLAAYQFAPVAVALSPDRLPAGWIAAVYGSERPAGWKLVAEVPGGALMWPAPQAR